MKIGILTFWWSKDNYGQLLQAYALQKYLRDRGHDAFLIRYRPDEGIDLKRTPFALRLLKALNPVKLARYLAWCVCARVAEREYRVYDRQFDAFREKYIAWSPALYSSYEELRGNPPEADCYIVGSDQMWNFGDLPLARCRNTVHAYFLDFGSPEIKRIAYAASWGRETLTDEYVQEITPLLARFSYIGVREKSGVALCALCRKNDAEWVRDPTLLLGAKIYRALYRAEYARVPDAPYVFFYYLGNGGSFDKESVFAFARKRGLSVQYVSGNGNVDTYQKNYATIPEWLALVDHAEYVVTNSFHCCVFSLLFGKRFGAVRLTGTAAGMNTRLASLFELTGCPERYITETDFSALELPAAAPVLPECTFPL